MPPGGGSECSSWKYRSRRCKVRLRQSAWQKPSVNKCRKRFPICRRFFRADRNLGIKLSFPQAIKGVIVDRHDVTCSRRGILKGASALAASVAVGGWPAWATEQSTPSTIAPAAHPDITGQLSTYMSLAGDRDLPPEVEAKAKQHILDTLTAMVSGANLLPAQTAVKFARAYGGEPVATVVGTNIVCGPIEAALANG